MITVNDHELIGIDAHGSLCSCGVRTPRWEHHLYLVALRDLGVPFTDEQEAIHGRARRVHYADQPEEWKVRRRAEQRAARARVRDQQDAHEREDAT